MAKQLGCLSEKYESSGNPGAISHSDSDYGNQLTGGSYGCYQMLATVTKAYIASIKTTYPIIYASLIKYTCPSTDFDNAWKYMAKVHYDDFKKSQHEYIKAKYYDVAVSNIKSKLNFDVTAKSFALKNAIWSTAVQHGTGAVVNIISRGINGKTLSAMTDKEIITAIYTERGANNGAKYFSNSSASVQKAVCNRFKSELADALVLLTSVSSEGLTLDEVKTEIVRALNVTIERINAKQTIQAQITYIEKQFDEYVKLGGK